MTLPKLKSKGLLILLGLVVIIAVGLVIVIAAGRDKSHESATVVLVRQSQINLPAGTITPTQLSQSGATKYANKQVRVYGIIVKLSGNQYAVADQTSNKPTAVVLGPSKTINFATYATKTYQVSGHSRAIESVTVIGTYTVSFPQSPHPGQIASAQLIVNSIQP
jgi:hypothetical protein